MYIISFYVPESHLEQVKQAMFGAGAGKMGHYDQVCWQCKGLGQYRPLAGSHAYQGKINQLEKDEEYKVEMVCEDDRIDQIIAALKSSHPYEEPAFFVIKDDYKI